MSEELKLCDCGATPELVRGPGAEFVKCPKCGRWASGSSAKQSIAMWNWMRETEESPNGEE
jgi:hypothetical protein